MFFFFFLTAAATESTTQRLEIFHWVYVSLSVAVPGCRPYQMIPGHVDRHEEYKAPCFPLLTIAFFSTLLVRLLLLVFAEKPKKKQSKATGNSIILPSMTMVQFPKGLHEFRDSNTIHISTRFCFFSRIGLSGVGHLSPSFLTRKKILKNKVDFLAC